MSSNKKNIINISILPFGNTNLGAIIYLILRVLAVMVSWFYNKSILWAIFHFFFGVIYLIYRLLIGSFANGGFIEIINFYF